MPVQQIVLFTLGGTIAMAGTEDGVVARLGGRDLLAGYESGAGVELEVRDLPPVPSASLTFGAVLDAVDAARRAVVGGASGVVLTQGTDTLEETAFLIDSVWSDDAPFVVTGAMRNPTLPGADGPANIAAAVRVASAPAARGRGALVVFADEIHAARFVRKTHSSSPATFRSPDLGPIGHVIEGAPRFRATLAPRRPITGIDRTRLVAARVALHVTTLDDDWALLDGLGATHAGLVVAGFGVGHVAEAAARRLGDLAATIPVVLTSRTGSGSVFAATYGARGAERDLLARGLINAGFVHPYQARVLLRLLLGAGASRTAIAAAFAELA